MKRSHTRCGGDEIGTGAAADDTDRRGTRQSGNRNRCDDVDDDELRALRLEAGAPESLLDEEEGAAAADWKCDCRYTSVWRENKSLITVVSASLSRIPLGSKFFPGSDGAGADGTTWSCGTYCRSTVSGGKTNIAWEKYRRNVFVRRKRIVTRGLLEHTGDDLLERLGALPESPRERQIPPPNARFLFLAELFRFTRSSLERLSALIGTFTVAGNLLVFIPELRSLAVRVIG